MQYINHNKNDGQGFNSLMQGIQTLSHQLTAPDAALFQSVNEQRVEMIGLREALISFAMEEDWVQLAQALQRIQSVVNLLNCPILGIAGLLNSGKSSFVASYLSATGRRRILRGDASSCGTQRFVLWLPEKWRQDDALWAELVAQISELFCGRYEMLSDDLQSAHRQYNQLAADQQVLDVPLIATDPGLDNLALLDCPDVQRSDDALSAAKREAFLRQAAPICSAFLFVATQKNIADEKAGKVAGGLRDMMPDIPFYLVMNQVEPDTDMQPHQFLQDRYIKHLIDVLNAEHFYVAYHYRIMGWDDMTPSSLHRLIQADDKAERVPAAWQVSPNAEDNVVEEVPAERYLIGLPERLESSYLAMSQIQSHWHRFQKQKRRLVSTLTRQVRHERQLMQALHQHLLDFCHQQTTDQANNPRLPLSPELIQKLHRGMEEGAPVYIRPLLLSGRKMQQLMSGGIEAVKRMLAHVRLIDKEALYAIKSQALSAQHLMESMRDHAGLRDYVKTASQDDLQQSWEAVLKKTDLSAIQLAGQLDDQKIAMSASGAWKKISPAKKAYAIVQGMLALLVSLSVVLLIPFDFGASAVTQATVLAQASLPELVTAAGLGGMSGWGFASTSLARTLEKELFVPYFSDFFHFACDAFGLPRQISSQPAAICLQGGQYKLQQSELPGQSLPIQYHPPRFWSLNQAGFDHLEQTIRQVDALLPEKA